LLFALPANGVPFPARVVFSPPKVTDI